MAQRKSLKDDACPVARAVDVVGDRWALLIVRDAFDGISRFGDFRNSLGMAKNILSDRLRRLVAAGVLEAVAAADGSAYQDYVLTERGQALFPLIVGLRQWGEGELFAKGESHSVLVDRQSGQAVAPLAVQARDGRTLTAAQAVVRKLAPAQSPR